MSTRDYKVECGRNEKQAPGAEDNIRNFGPFGKDKIQVSWYRRSTRR